jgi:hypothetical protein
MIPRGVKVTFYFTINWTGNSDGVQPMFLAYKKAVSRELSAAQKAVFH